MALKGFLHRVDLEEVRYSELFFFSPSLLLLTIFVSILIIPKHLLNRATGIFVFAIVSFLRSIYSRPSTPALIVVASPASMVFSSGSDAALICFSLIVATDQ
ncbi:hypothetical protein M5K25_012049 [Dendrobium thyrsiflorum]|uniref:NADH dehydrogenase subunit 2 n=1 Tax=Dendrobium thyrsiflorum TaxID=117978 RepID=A0ABD0UWG9_DENTH